MQKRIVVLGGVGFIGSHLCLRLLNDGHEVFCVDIRDTADSPLLRDMPPHPEFRYVRHNIVNAFGIRCDEIYNLAAPSRVRYNKALPVESLKVSILGSINALDTARSEHARILYASTGDIYGTGYADKVLSIKTAYEQMFLDRGLPITYTRFTLDDTVRFDWFDWEEDDKLKCEKDCEEARRR